MVDHALHPDEFMKSVSHGRKEVRSNLERVFSILYDRDSVRTTVH